MGIVKRQEVIVKCKGALERARAQVILHHTINFFIYRYRSISRRTTVTSTYIMCKWRAHYLQLNPGAAARNVTAKPTGCGYDPHSRWWNIYLNLYFHFFALVSRLSAALSSATQHAMPPEIFKKWGTTGLNTRFPLPTLMCAGYSVKLI